MNAQRALEVLIERHRRLTERNGATDYNVETEEAINALLKMYHTAERMWNENKRLRGLCSSFIYEDVQDVREVYYPLLKRVRDEGHNADTWAMMIRETDAEIVNTIYDTYSSLMMFRDMQRRYDRESEVYRLLDAAIEQERDIHSMVLMICESETGLNVNAKEIAKNLIYKLADKWLYMYNTNVWDNVEIYRRKSVWLVQAWARMLLIS